MDKRISVQVNCNRKVSGVLRGFDAFMNIVLDETVEECKTGTLPMGTIVNAEKGLFYYLFTDFVCYFFTLRSYVVIVF